MNKTYFSIYALILNLLICIPAISQKSALLPLGDAVSYLGTDCGRINYLWVPGEISRTGRFSSYDDLIKNISARIKKEKNKKKKNALKKLSATYAKRKNSGQVNCDQLNVGVVPPNSSQSPASGHTTIAWNKSVGDNVEFPIGADYKFFCPPSGQINLIWGTFDYSSDSSVCYAAVHAGLITLNSGGNVTARVTDGKKGYFSGLRSGIKSSSYPSWPKTFSFVNPNNNEIVRSQAPIVVSWDAGMGNYRNTDESELTFLCPANGKKGSLWGTETYTDDSSVCTAAVHAGKIKFLRGGLVTAVKKPGQTSYTGSNKNGVSSSNYGNWGGSFSIK